MAGYAGYTMSSELLNFFYRGVAITIGGSLYLRLLVAPSSRAGGGTETNYSGYARLELQRTTGGLFAVAATNGQLTNSALLAFPTAVDTGNGQLVAFDIVDTPSGAFSKVYNGGPINPAKTLVPGKPPVFAIGALVITF
jgi:hypothetical protein